MSQVLMEKLFLNDIWGEHSQFTLTKISPILPPIHSSLHTLTLTKLPPNVNIDIWKITVIEIHKHVCRLLNKYNNSRIKLFFISLPTFLMTGIYVNINIGKPPTPLSCQSKYTAVYKIIRKNFLSWKFYKIWHI